MSQPIPDTPAPQQTTESLGIESVDEGQNTTILAQVAKDVRTILTPNETIAYIAHQNRTAFGQKKDAAVATNNRIILYRPHRFGRLEFHDFLWEDVRDVTIAEKVWSSQFTCVTTDDRTLQLGGLVKEQARTLYAFCQQKEQEWRERRRVRQMEEERARAGGVQVTLPSAGGTPPAGEAAAGSAEDPVAALAKAKQLFDQELISEAEYETLKAKILSTL